MSFRSITPPEYVPSSFFCPNRSDCNCENIGSINPIFSIFDANPCSIPVTVLSNASAKFVPFSNAVAMASLNC